MGVSDCYCSKCGAPFTPYTLDFLVDMANMAGVYSTRKRAKMVADIQAANVLHPIETNIAWLGQCIAYDQSGKKKELKDYNSYGGFTCTSTLDEVDVYDLNLKCFHAICDKGITNWNCRSEGEFAKYHGQEFDIVQLIHDGGLVRLLQKSD